MTLTTRRRTSSIAVILSASLAVGLGAALVADGVGAGSLAGVPAVSCHCWLARRWQVAMTIGELAGVAPRETATHLPLRLFFSV